VTTETAIQIDHDGIDRRGFLKCMAWAGTGMLFTMQGGILSSFPLRSLLDGGREAKDAVANSSFNFVQISDSHIGFSKEANKDVLGTLQAAVNQINATKASPDLLIHTGDLSHLSRADEFDALDQILKASKRDTNSSSPGNTTFWKMAARCTLTGTPSRAKGRAGTAWITRGSTSSPLSTCST